MVSQDKPSQRIFFVTRRFSKVISKLKCVLCDACLLFKSDVVRYILMHRDFYIVFNENVLYTKTLLTLFTNFIIVYYKIKISFLIYNVLTNFYRAPNNTTEIHKYTTEFIQICFKNLNVH